MILRPYQSRALDAAKSALRASVDPIIIDAAPAAGKSFMVAALADWLHEISGGKRVLCLQPSATLTEQNAEKMAMTGHRFSIFSASAGAKSTRHNIVLATPGTVKNAISRFANGDFCGVIVDEAHGTTPTIRAIIEAMRAANPKLRVVGLTGTPYVIGKGYIYRVGPDGRANGDDVCRDPYYTQCVYRVSAREMLDEGYITPMDVGRIDAEAYDTSGLALLPNGHFNDAEVERAFVGHGRKTAAIVGDVMRQAALRGGSNGIMYFGATVAHAHEILASLPPENSALVTGDDCRLNGRPAPRKAVIAAYRDKRVRHIVSVGSLTTGFDISHTEIIALLRRSESPALLQQIMGRAWRLDDDKPRALLLDYAGNLDALHPDGDIYNPVIRATGGTKVGGGEVEAQCPACATVNSFSRHKDAEGYNLDVNGYCLDVFGQRIETDFGPMPGHYGRRCFGMVRTGSHGESDRCAYYWTSKKCEACGELNDISARRCRACGGELIDPNEKLAADFAAHKKNPYDPQTDRVLSMNIREGVSQRGNATVRADWKTPHRQFSVWFQKEAKHPQARRDWERFQAATEYGQPETISYVKDRDSGFYRVLAFGQPEDVAL